MLLIILDIQTMLMNPMKTFTQKYLKCHNVNLTKGFFVNLPFAVGIKIVCTILNENNSI